MVWLMRVDRFTTGTAFIVIDDAGGVPMMMLITIIIVIICICCCRLARYLCLLRLRRLCRRRHWSSGV